MPRPGIGDTMYLPVLSVVTGSTRPWKARPYRRGECSQSIIEARTTYVRLVGSWADKARTTA
ncbi:hypothetical protein K466DRAFT_583890 [Polyporus arcularius HHB13444]|uniref:Uncharacterized protein n=1 Tax=Polyporus arcularius HHB13444 TaxID=1314778 RepID=A0A5C3PLV1_9APHY|nr:hypothetical protein K466DRAFT_583890 [Polyporus arcularius HHB13444]